MLVTPQSLADNVAAFGSAPPVNDHIDQLRLAAARQDNVVDEQAYHGAPVSSPRGRRSPQRRQVGGQRPDPLALGCSQCAGLLGLEARVIFLQLPQRRQRLLPAPLQLTSDEAVLRLGGVVLA